MKLLVALKSPQENNDAIQAAATWGFSVLANHNLTRQIPDSAVCARLYKLLLPHGKFVISIHVSCM